MTTITQASLKIGAAILVLEGRQKDWLAALLVGLRSERELARDGVLAAMETVLDAQEFHADLVHQQGREEA